MPNILERLKKMKEDSHLTSQQIADISKIPLSTVNRIMSGQTDNPTFESIAAIVKAMDGSLDELAGITKKGVPVPPDESILSSYKEIIAAKDDKYSSMVASKDEKYNDMVLAKNEKYADMKERYEVAIKHGEKRIVTFRRWLQSFTILIMTVFVVIIVYLAMDAANPSWGIFRG